MPKARIGQRKWAATRGELETTRRMVRQRLGRLVDDHLTREHRLRLVAEALELTDTLADYVQALVEIAEGGGVGDESSD